MKPYSYSPLLTDLYQLTMAYGYWRLNMHEQEAAFHLMFRNNPFKGNYTLSCGLASVVDFLQQWRFAPDDLTYLATLKNSNHEPLFPQPFLDYLEKLQFTCDIDAMPEGTLVFPQEPLLRIQGPLLQCQLLESPLLNIMNFQTLIATKASRVCRAAQGDEVIEFGLRRAQGPDGAISASRAAHIGGCASTSNTLAGKLFNIPVRGTHAHSWVTAFASELESFAAYASVMPHNCVLLVDTFHTLAGVKNAIAVGKKLRATGGELLAIRLDSGDMADLSIQARTMLDQAGFTETKIIASNSLDEYTITALKQQGAKITAWGVGTNLVTAYDQPALDGVYKLAALREKDGEWLYKLKLSEQETKISTPGRQQVRRFFCNGRYVMDVMYDLALGITDAPETVSNGHDQSLKKPAAVDGFVDLLTPLFRGGELVQQSEPIHLTRQRAMAEVARFSEMYAEREYPVALEKKLFELKQKLIADLK